MVVAGALFVTPDRPEFPEWNRTEFSEPAKTARGNWARFIKKVFELDPLLCPDCGGVMKIISFIEDPSVIRAILLHLALWDVPRARPPPVSAGGPVDFEYVPCED